MKNYFETITYLRRKERKSAIYVFALLMLTSFTDDLYLFLVNTNSNVNYFSQIDTQESASSSIEKDQTTFTPSEKKEQIFNDKPIANTKKYKSIQPKTSQFNKSKENSDTSALTPTFSKDEAITNSVIKKYKNEEDNNFQQASMADNSMETNNNKIVLPSEPLDPNNVTEDQLLSLGLSTFAAKNWTKYTKAGGKFYKSQDFLKVYGIEVEQMKTIKSAFSFPEKKTYAPKPIMVSINTATAQDFQQVKGIGNILSKRIVKFRDKLGGFHSIDQIREVYGIEDSIITQQKHLFQISEEPALISINAVTADELAQHPYISANAARIIVNYRKQHGSFTQINDLSNIRILDEKFINKVEPYLVFDE